MINSQSGRTRTNNQNCLDSYIEILEDFSINIFMIIKIK